MRLYAAINVSPSGATKTLQDEHSGMKMALKLFPSSLFSIPSSFSLNPPRTVADRVKNPYPKVLPHNYVSPLQVTYPIKEPLLLPGSDSMSYGNGVFYIDYHWKKTL